MSGWVDATLPLSNHSVVWPGDPPVRILPTLDMNNGDVCNESRLELGSHNATDIDAPRHFDAGGLRVDRLDPHLLVGPAWVIESPEALLVGVRDLRRVPDGEFTRVILKTRNTVLLEGSSLFHQDYVGLSAEGARYLVERGCRLVGTDYYSICPFDDVVTTHRILLCSGVAIIESLVLREVREGPVNLIALPLKIAGGDASPARVLIGPRRAAGELRGDD